MALSQVGTGDSFDLQNPGSGSGTLDRDTGVAAGDLELILVSWYEGGNDWNVNTPSGFTAYTQLPIDTSGGVGESRIAVFSREVVGGEGTTITVSFTGASSLFGTVLLMTLRGSSALSVASVTVGTRANGTTCTAPDVAGTSGQGLVAAMGTGDPTTMTTPTDMTAGTVGLQNTNTGRFFYQTLTGDVGAKTSTLGTTRDNGAFSILIDGADAGGGTVNTETLESTISVSDEPLDYVFYNRMLDSSVSLFDELVIALAGTVSKILESAITVDDGAQLFILRNRLLQDTIVVTEGTLDQFVTNNVIVDDTIEVVDSVIRYLQFNRLGESALVVTDSLISAIINYSIQTAVLSSAIEVTDEASHFVYVTRLVESAIALFDEQLPHSLRFILLTDALSVDDSATATYVPDPGTPGQVFNPVIRIGFDQPRIDLGGYALN